jgi:hypothetical protein
MRPLWANKEMLIIDKINMVSSKLTDSTDKQRKVMMNIGSHSTAVFGGLYVVIVLDGFQGFSPTQARASEQPR